MSVQTIGGVVHDQVVVPDAPLPEGYRVAITAPRTADDVLAEMAAALAPLVRGDCLSLDEFLRRWEAMPALKRAELIRGVVYMPSPSSRLHGVMDQNVGGCLMAYRAATPGVEGATNASWVMGNADAPQPDNSLYILPEYGGRLGMHGTLLKGTPDFLEETCVTSTSYDLHQKLDVYQEAGVQEYLAVILQRNEVRWHRLVNHRFEVQPAAGGRRVPLGCLPRLMARRGGAARATCARPGRAATGDRLAGARGLRPPAGGAAAP